MGRTVCTEPQCLYKGALYPYLLIGTLVDVKNSQLLNNYLDINLTLGALQITIIPKFGSPEFHCSPTPAPEA